MGQKYLHDHSDAIALQNHGKIVLLIQHEQDLQQKATLKHALGKYFRCAELSAYLILGRCLELADHAGRLMR
jgi:hypothetical protein